MSMIENHFSLNLAYNGTHYARVDFSCSTTEAEAKQKAGVICSALSATFGDPAKWSFSLAKIHCYGEGVEFKYKS